MGLGFGAMPDQGQEVWYEGERWQVGSGGWQVGSGRRQWVEVEGEGGREGGEQCSVERGGARSAC